MIEEMKNIIFIVKSLPIAITELIKYLYIHFLGEKIYKGFVEFNNPFGDTEVVIGFIKLVPTPIRKIPLNVSVLTAGNKIYHIKYNSNKDNRYIDIPALKFELKKKYFISYDGKTVKVYMHKKDLLEFKLKH